MTNSRSGNVIEVVVCVRWKPLSPRSRSRWRKNAIPKAVLHLSTRGANKDSVSRPSAMLVVGVQCAAQKEALRFVVVPFWPFRSYSL